jgi:2-polyprenyl-6-methoxyphenol hydroxylase-like FAD-dependent oxidoreductase
MLYDNLPEGMVRFAHRVASYKQEGGQVSVVAEAPARVAGSQPQRFEIRCDLLVAADGSNSTIRKIMHPDDQRRCETASGQSICRGSFQNGAQDDRLKIWRNGKRLFRTGEFFTFLFE